MFRIVLFYSEDVGPARQTLCDLGSGGSGRESGVCASRRVAPEPQRQGRGWPLYRPSVEAKEITKVDIKSDTCLYVFFTVYYNNTL